MIIVGGTKLSEKDLPNSDLMSYSLSNNVSDLRIKLRVTAKLPTCLKVYLSREISNDVPFAQLPKDKVVIFEDDTELVQLLLKGNNKTSEDKKQTEMSAKSVSTEKVEPNNSIESSTNNVSLYNPNNVDTNVVKDDSVVLVGTQTSGLTISSGLTINSEIGVDLNGVNQIESVDYDEVDTDLPTIFFDTPNLYEDIDALKLSLDNKDKLLKNANIAVESLKKAVEEKNNAISERDNLINKLKEDKALLISNHRESIIELKSSYEDTVVEANKTIAKLKSNLDDAKLDDDILAFCKYSTYAKNPKASSRECFNDEGKQVLSKLKSNVHILSCGGGDSLYRMLSQLTNVINGRGNAVIVDFTNDSYLKAKHKITNGQMSSILIGDEKYSVSQLVSRINKVDLIPSSLFNDISLLMLDWVEVLKKLDYYANGRDIILVFNNINNFTVRHTVSKLATVGQLNVFVKCNPLVLSSMWGDLKFIPSERVKIVSMDFIPMVKNVLEEFGKTHSVEAFDKDIEWGRLGIYA